MNHKKSIILEYISIIAFVITLVFILFLISPINSIEAFNKSIVDATLGELFLTIFIAVLSAGFLLRR